MQSQNNDDRYAVGIDIGGTKIAIGIVNDKGHLLNHIEEKTPVEEGEKAVERLILECVLKLSKTAPSPPLAVGLGVAGQIDGKTGHIIFAPNLYWHNVPLNTRLQEALKIPVISLNDVRAATIAEWVFGAGKNQTDVLCAFVGTGIGAGVISGGKLLIGSSNTFGEVGHMTIDSKGPYCTCGKRGCFETLAAGRTLATRAKQKILHGNQITSTKLLELSKGNIEILTSNHVIEAYRLDDKLAIEIIDEVKESLIVGFSNLINITNPHLLILGGGLIFAMPELIPIIKEGIFQNSLKAATRSFDVVKATFENHAGVIGSATAAFQALKGYEL